MKVAIDGRRMQDRPPNGVSRLLVNLVPLVIPAVSVVLLTDRRRPPVDGPWDQQALARPGWAPEPVWLQSAARRWLRGFDGVFHGTYNAIPFGCPVPAVVSFYDLSFEHHREDFRVDKLLAWRVQARHAAREARAVVTISRFVSGDLTETYGIDPARIHLAPPSVDPVFGPERASGAEAVLDRLGAPRPYVVALGGPRRRRLDIAVEAWRRLRQAGGTWPLVVVGRQAPATEPGVFHAGVLEDAEWAAVLAGADALCYPTRYEGFGLPALEAAASGTPVVCAPTGPLPEVLGDAAAWCADSTAESVAETLAALLGDPARHQALVDAGLRRAAAAPTWADSAAALVGAYLAAAGT